MSTSKLIEARKLVDFIEGNNAFLLIHSNFCNYSNHIPALFTDIVLQAGLNYKSVVAPRVKKVLSDYPNCITINDFCQLLDYEVLENIISWKNEIKLTRMRDLLNYCLANEINTSEDLKLFLLEADNKSSFLNLKGFGDKTYDYLLKLLNVDTIAVDRHIYSFLDMAGIVAVDYNYSKSIVETAADLMDIPRRSIDYSIWYHMAYENKKSNSQTLLEFS